MCKINQESITLLESLSGPCRSYCVQAMLLLASKSRAIEIKGMVPDKWVDRRSFAVLAAEGAWPHCAAGGGESLLIVCFSFPSTAGWAALKASSALECFILRVFPSKSEFLASSVDVKSKMK